MTATRVAANYRLLDRNAVITALNGAIMLGRGSSYKPGKLRWFEVTLYVTEDDEYVVHTVGKSIVEGEVDRGRVERTSSPYDVVELLTVRMTSARDGLSYNQRRRDPYVPQCSVRALAQAAEYDDGIHDAYMRLVRP